MKVIVVVLFLLLIAIALFLGLSMPSAAPPLAGVPVPTAPQNVSTPATAVAPGSAGKPAEGVVATTVNDLKQTADYATGYTPLKIKKSSEKKINDINAAHNAAVEKAINEN